MKALLLAAMMVTGAKYKVTEGSTVQFLAHITHGSFTATNKAVTGVVELDDARKVVNGAIVVKANAFTTGMAMRDTHMREKYLEAEKYPVIALDLTGATLPDTGETDIDGTLEVHGVKKPVRLHVAIADGGSGVRVATSAFIVNITDYGIPQPSFAVVKMETRVEVSVTIRFVQP